jgi:acyl-CoA reductase-like NAD-dependent aldehyde dehydrogenase
VTFVLRARADPRDDRQTRTTGRGVAIGGVKNSGLGREETLEEIESYTQHKNVYIRF